MKIKNLFAVAIATLALYSCQTPKNISYFQDLPTETKIQMAEAQQIKLQPDDKLSIVVNCADPQLQSLFNITVAQRTFGGTSGATSSNNGVATYTIDKNGNIDFPVIGEIHVAGLSRSEVASKIKTELTSRQLIQDPTVTVEYANLQISVLGDVSHPGRISISRDYYTILDAISEAGDLTITGKRENVTVLRRNGNEQQVFKLNLCSDSSLINSPAYYIKQGDIVYVEPNNMKARQSTVNGNSVLSYSFWFSLISLASSLAVLIFK